jgi:glycosyltransferase involved in cell wall biosynthesis
MQGISRARVGFDARYINDRYHGIGRYAFSLIRALAGLAPEVDFVLFTGREQDSRFPLSNLESLPNVSLQAGPWPLYLPSEQIHWARLLRKHGIDLFHSPYFANALLSAVPSIITVHDLIFERYPEYMPSRWARPYYRLLMAASIRKAKKVITVSRATETDLHAYYPAARGKTDVISEGADPHFKRTAQPQDKCYVHERYQIDFPYILAVGAHRPHKNFGRLVQAFGRVRDRIPHRMVFAGSRDPRFHDESEEQVKKLGLSNRVRFLDWVEEKDLPLLYSQADLVAMPSLIEGFGLPALEAMACGTPVLSSNATSLPEVTGNAGIEVDPLNIESIASGLVRALCEPGERERMSVEGIKRAASFTWGNTASQCLQIYRQVLSTGNRSSAT